MTEETLKPESNNNTSVWSGVESYGEIRELHKDILAASKQNTTVHTVAPPRTELNFGGESRTGSGFTTFGSADIRGRAYDNYVGVEQTPKHLGGQPHPEAVQFKYTVSKPVYEEYVTGIFKNKTARRFVGNRDMELPEVLNPITGRTEAGALFKYQFSSQTRDGYWDGLPLYKTDYAINGRSGNVLCVEAVLPKSIAEKLEKAVVLGEIDVRGLVRDLVLEEGRAANIEKEKWEKAWSGDLSDEKGQLLAAIRPPYDKLPTDWQIAVFDSKGSIEAMLKPGSGAAPPQEQPGPKAVNEMPMPTPKPSETTQNVIPRPQNHPETESSTPEAQFSRVEQATFAQISADRTQLKSDVESTQKRIENSEYVAREVIKEFELRQKTIERADIYVRNYRKNPGKMIELYGKRADWLTVNNFKDIAEVILAESEAISQQLYDESTKPGFGNDLEASEALLNSLDDADINVMAAKYILETIRQKQRELSTVRL